MKKNLLLLSFFVFGAVAAKAQLYLRVVNNTSCTIQYSIRLDNFDGGSCVDGVSGIYSVAPGGQAAHTAASVIWSWGTPIAGAGFSGSRVYGTMACGGATDVGEICAGLAPNGTISTCGSCPGFNVTWTAFPGAGYVLRFN